MKKKVITLCMKYLKQLGIIPMAIYLLFIGTMFPFTLEIFSENLNNFFWNVSFREWLDRDSQEYYPGIVWINYLGVSIALLLSTSRMLAEKTTAKFTNKENFKTSVHQESSAILALFFVMFEFCSILFAYLRFA